MIVFDVIFGALLLFTGRKLFWLSVGIMGFLVGVAFAEQLASQIGELMVIFCAVLFGIFGALLAVAFQWGTIILLGILGGGYFLMNIPLMAGQSQPSWWLFLLGGIMGMLVMVFAFDWALIGISSLLGAMLLVQHLEINETLRGMLFLSSAILGIWVQCGSV